MSSQGYSPAQIPFQPANGSGRPWIWKPSRGRRNSVWVHVLLFVVTLFTTTLVGAELAYNFEHNRPSFASTDVEVLAELVARPSSLLSGLPYALTLLLILLAHELGHYLACRYYRIDATLPFFLPLPVGFGTLGAFIRIRSPIYTRRALFDVGVAGPLAGFVLVAPAFAVGLALSKVAPGIAGQGELIFGSPLIQRLLEAVLLPGVDGGDIYLHPVARAAWVGVLATALNLLPIGQLDGGHILYSFAGRHHRLLSRAFILLLVPLGLRFTLQWLFWAAILFAFTVFMRHPPIQDTAPLGRGRKKLGLVALAVFILSFSLAPVRIADGL